MPPALATVVCAAGVVGLFLLDRDRGSRASPALWIAVAWLAIGASREISQWSNPTLLSESAEQLHEGSPLDRVFYTGLMVAGLIVLCVRGERTGRLLRANWPVLVFFVYCAVSVAWSDYPFVAFKRWTKVLGNLVMVLVALTDRDPREATRQLLTRTGFVLIPLSVLLIKYYPYLGRAFSPWTGAAYNSGAAIGKNGLGVMCLVFGLTAVWRCLDALQEPERRTKTRRLIAHGSVLAMALWLFWLADSATSLGCFAVGAALIVLSRWRPFASSAVVVHVAVAGIVSVCVLGLFITTDVGLLQAMGRDPTLTTRTGLWHDLLRISVDPWFGTGFDSFWLGARARILWQTHWWHPNQAHNGYLEVYLNLGWLGLVLLGVMIAGGYRNVIAALRGDAALGGFRLALFVVAVLYNLTEAAFKVMHPVWILFLLVVSIVPKEEAATAGARLGGRDSASASPLRPLTSRSPLRPVTDTLKTPRARRAWAPRH